MSRYIDADAFCKEIVKIQDLRKLSTKTIGEALDRTPTADVVEVVRCKDCKWFYDNECIDPRGMVWSLSEHYCSCGERREDEQIH